MGWAQKPLTMGRVWSDCVCVWYQPKFTTGRLFKVWFIFYHGGRYEHLASKRVQEKKERISHWLLRARDHTTSEWMRMRCVSRPSMLVIKPFNHLLDFPVLQKKMSKRWSKHGRPDPESQTLPSLGSCGVWTVWPPHWRCIGTTILSGILDLERVLPKKMYIYWVFEARRSSQGTFHACGRPLTPLVFNKK